MAIGNIFRYITVDGNIEVLAQDSYTPLISSNYKEILKGRDHEVTLFLCFMDYKKVFGCECCEELWIILIQLGISVHLVQLGNLIMNRYTKITESYFEYSNSLF